MLPYIHIIVPVYTLFAVLGFVMSLLLFIKRSCILSLGMFKNMQIVSSAVIGMLVGSRLVFVLTMFRVIMKDFSFKQVFRVVFGGGFVFYGGLLGAIGGVYLYARVRKINMDDLFQAVVPCFPLFHAFGRIGCFMSGCCYGIPCSFGFAMAAEPDITRFPIQLVESMFCIVIFTILLMIENYFPTVDLLKVYLISYAAARFGLEFLRGDIVRGFLWCFSTSQWISLSIIAFYIIKKIIFNKQK